MTAYEFESNSGRSDMNNKKQIPSITTRLTAELRFASKVCSEPPQIETDHGSVQVLHDEPFSLAKVSCVAFYIFVRGDRWDLATPLYGLTLILIIILVYRMPRHTRTVFSCAASCVQLHLSRLVRCRRCKFFTSLTRQWPRRIKSAAQRRSVGPLQQKQSSLTSVCPAWSNVAIDWNALFQPDPAQSTCTRTRGHKSFFADLGLGLRSLCRRRRGAWNAHWGSPVSRSNRRLGTKRGDDLREPEFLGRSSRSVGVAGGVGRAVRSRSF